MVSRESFVNLSDEVFERVGVDPEFSEHLDKPSLTYWADVWRRFKQNMLAIFGLVLMVSILVMIFVGPLISGKNYKYMDSSVKNLRPNSEYWFGTDDMGRDIFTRVCYGGRISILIGFLCTIVMFVIGSTLGALAGLKGGWLDNLIMRFAEVIGNLPYLIIVVILTMVMGRSIFAIVLAMSITSWVGTCRMVRGQILQLKELDYIEAATALGADMARVIFKHLLPNALGIIMVDITISIPGFILERHF